MPCTSVTLVEVPIKMTAGGGTVKNSWDIGIYNITCNIFIAPKHIKSRTRRPKSFLEHSTCMKSCVLCSMFKCLLSDVSRHPTKERPKLLKFWDMFDCGLRDHGLGRCRGIYNFCLNNFCLKCIIENDVLMFSF
jgi:hypothetical protein